MKINALGKFLRKLRLDTGEFMADMAYKLGVSPSCLSLYETSDRQFPKEKLYDKIVDAYDLDDKKKRELDDAIELSSSTINLKKSKANDNQKGLVFALARKMEELTNDDIEEIKRILKKD